MVRHKATSEYMPQLKKGRGYTFWNPSKVDTREILGHKLLGVPRLFPSRRSAHCTIVQWNSMPNARWHSSTSYYGEQDDDVDTKPDDRSKNDLEIVEVNIEEIK